MRKVYTGKWLVRMRGNPGLRYFTGPCDGVLPYSDRQHDALKLRSKALARTAIQPRIAKGYISLEHIVFVRLYRMVP